MCMDMCRDMCLDMYMDRCIDRCIEVCIDMRVDMHVEMRDRHLPVVPHLAKDRAAERGRNLSLVPKRARVCKWCIM